MQNTSFNIMAADDHLLFLEGVDSLIQTIPNMVLTEKLPDADALVEIFTKQPVDLVLIDLSMPGLSTEPLIEKLLSIKTDVKIIALTMHNDAYRAIRLFKMGLHGYVLKDSAFESLSCAIESVLKQGNYVSTSLKTEMDLINSEDSKQILTQRETAVIIEIAKGSSNKDVAKKLNISERTVRFHLTNCCCKLKANSRTEAASIAYLRNLIPS